MNYEYGKFIPQGWVCPVCGRVYAPSESMCLYCWNGVQITNSPANTFTQDAQRFVHNIMTGKDADGRMEDDGK